MDMQKIHMIKGNLRNQLDMDQLELPESTPVITSKPRGSRDHDAVPLTTGMRLLLAETFAWRVNP